MGLATMGLLISRDTILGPNFGAKIIVRNIVQWIASFDQLIQNSFWRPASKG